MEKDKEVYLGERIETITTSCDNCGAVMVFAPDIQALRCPHCESVKEFTIDHEVEELILEQDFQKGEMWDDGEDVYRCENCGAVVVVGAGTSATICPYCETGHIVKSEERAGLKPNAIYPFTITESSGVQKAITWAKKRFFAPRNFKRNLRAENVKGVYQPCFTFDSQTISKYYGRVGDRRTRTVGSGKDKRVETYIVWRTIAGTFQRNFDDVMINASSAYEQSTLNKLQPFDYEKIAKYEQKVLTGFIARRYEKDLSSAWKDATKSMDAIIRQEIINMYHCDVVDYVNVSTSHSAVTYKYVLVPIYILNFTYKKKKYPIYINGNTGKVAGKTPVSVWRVLGVVLLSLAVIAAIACLIYLNQ